MGCLWDRPAAAGEGLAAERGFYRSGSEVFVPQLLEAAPKKVVRPMSNLLKASTTTSNRTSHKGLPVLACAKR